MKYSAENMQKKDFEYSAEKNIKCGAKNKQNIVQKKQYAEKYEM